MKRFAITTVALAACVFGLSGCETAEKADAPTTQASLGILNEYCPGKPDEAVNPDVATVDYEGYQIGFCCAGCTGKWEAMSGEDKAAFVQTALDAQK